MRVFLAVSCLLAVASAGYYGPPAPANSGHYGGGPPQHIPVLTDNGVPQETPEVAAARANHLAALSQAQAHHAANPNHDDSGEYNYNDAQSNNYGYNDGNNNGEYNNGAYNNGGYNNGGYNDGGYNQGYNSAPQYSGPPQHHHHHQQQQPIPAIGPNGVPQDAPDVAAAKAAHFAAYDKVNALLGHQQPGPAPYQAPAPQYHQPAPAYHQSAPAYNPGPAYNPAAAYNSAPPYNPGAASYNPHQGPAPAGPVDTPEVAAARAAHFAAHSQAASHAGHGYNNGQY